MLSLMQRLHNEQLASALEVSAVDIFERSFFDSAWNERSIDRSIDLALPMRAHASPAHDAEVHIRAWPA